MTSALNSAAKERCSHNFDVYHSNKEKAGQFVARWTLRGEDRELVFIPDLEKFDKWYDWFNPLKTIPQLFVLVSKIKTFIYQHTPFYKLDIAEANTVKALCEKAERDVHALGENNPLLKAYCNAVSGAHAAPAPAFLADGNQEAEGLRGRIRELEAAVADAAGAAERAVQERIRGLEERLRHHENLAQQANERAQQLEETHRAAVAEHHERHHTALGELQTTLAGLEAKVSDLFAAHKPEKSSHRSEKKERHHRHHDAAAGEATSTVVVGSKVQPLQQDEGATVDGKKPHKKHREDKTGTEQQ